MFDLEVMSLINVIVEISFRNWYEWYVIILQMCRDFRNLTTAT